MSDEEWGPWIEHDGNGCPVSFGTVCHVVVGADEFGDPAHDPTPPDGEGLMEWIANDEWVEIVLSDDGWLWSEDWYPIIRYRIRKPSALRDLIELVENLPVPSQPKVPA